MDGGSVFPAMVVMIVVMVTVMVIAAFVLREIWWAVRGWMAACGFTRHRPCLKVHQSFRTFAISVIRLSRIPQRRQVP
ncbi:hypothetical protein E2C01_076812 [Portunus trituberculatus]|uniref:Uncharacterized protein n=1 Tax=Portunus trituberculatus TaxID=210409 RepID=A0A5B7IIQ7_PORTR|nr:hypothetical protein [Portunus trituberculatus]